MKSKCLIICVLLLVLLLIAPQFSCSSTKTYTITSKVIGLERSLENQDAWVHLENGTRLALSPYADISIGKIYMFTIQTTVSSPFSNEPRKEVKVIDYILIEVKE